MFIAGASHTPRLFSRSSAPPAAPTSSMSSMFHVHARSVAQGHAVVGTPVEALRRRPAGPSAVGTGGTLRRFMPPNAPVLQTPG